MLRGGGASAKGSVLTLAPTEGQTIAFTAGSADSTLYANTAGALLALTVSLPSEASSVIGQVVRVTSNNAVTTLTMQGATTILGAPSGLTLGTAASFQKIAANTWHRIS